MLVKYGSFSDVVLEIHIRKITYVYIYTFEIRNGKEEECF